MKLVYVLTISITLVSSQLTKIGAQAPTAPRTAPLAVSNAKFPATCTNPNTRKEIRQMEIDGDLPKFINAYKEMAKDGSLARLVNQHGPSPGYWDHAHFTPRFLLWHRLFIKDMEILLQSHGCPYLPYWDWSLDSQQPWLSPILGPGYFGAPDAATHKVANSEFAAGQYSAPVGGSPLIRDYNPKGPTNTFYHSSLLVIMMQNSNTFSIFSQKVEYGPHAVVHSMIGGENGDMSKWTSPNDPLFWLHHANVDRLFNIWQTVYNHQGEFDGDAYNVTMDASEMILPYNISAQNVLNINDVCMGGYIAPSQYILDNAQQLVGSIKAPDVGDNWLNNTGADRDIAKQIHSDAKQATDNVNKKIDQGIAVPRSVPSASNLNLPIGSLGLVVFLTLLALL